MDWLLELLFDWEFLWFPIVAASRPFTCAPENRLLAGTILILAIAMFVGAGLSAHRFPELACVLAIIGAIFMLVLAIGFRDPSQSQLWD